MKTLTAPDIWALPRVGSPVPAPDGRRVVVPVTTFDADTNEGTTRLHLVDSDGRRERPLTTAETSSGQPAISPDGERMAFVRKPPEKKKGGAKFADAGQLYVMPLGGGEPERLTDLPLGVAGPRWFADGKRIAFLSPVYVEAPTLAEAAERKNELEDSHLKVHVTEDRFYRYWDHWLTDGKQFHLFVLDLVNGEVMDLTPSFFGHVGVFDPGDAFDISPDGLEIAFEGCRNAPPYEKLVWSVWTVKVPRRIRSGARVARPRLLAPQHPANSTLPRYAPDGRSIVYGIKYQHDFYADRIRLVRFDRRKETHTVLTEDWKLSAGGWAFAADGQLWIQAEVEARTALFTLDPRRPATPEEVVRGGTYGPPCPAGGAAFCSRSTLRDPPEVFSVDPDSGKALRITFFTRDGMRGVKLSRVQEIRFEGAEDDQVQMFVLFPPGEKPRRAGASGPAFPLVHMIHGGPHGTFGDVWHWRWNAQAFAAPGYAVACVNFHGSTSFGQEFAECIMGRWGDQPYLDIMKATDLLVGRGIADPKRIAVTGGSYGGYLVSWIASQTDRFACIVNHAGVSDFQTQYASDVVHHRARSMGGEPWDDVEGLDRYNPIRHAAGFKSPMLVIHGMKDYRVPYNQGLEIYNVYRAMGLTARLVVYPDENHWILSRANSLHWYEEVLSWLGRFLS